MMETRMKSGAIPRKPPRRFSEGLAEGEHIPDVQREYIPKHEGEILDAVLRGHDIECELLDALRVVYEVNTAYHNRRWFAMDAREVTYGTVIKNPKTEDGSFPHLTSLLRWCMADMFDRTIALYDIREA